MENNIYRSLDFSNRFMRASAEKAIGVGLCSFLISLAAIQRGLVVRFLTKVDGVDLGRLGQSTDGQLYEVSDGSRTHLFSRTLPLNINRHVSRISSDKFRSKQLVHNAGVLTPLGVTGPASSRSIFERFTKDRLDLRYVVKPNSGSLAEKVVVDLSVDELLSELDKRGDETVVVEQYIQGKEFRIFVVGNEVVAVSLRHRPLIAGDGTHSVGELIDHRIRKLKKDNPFWAGFKSTEAMAAVVGRQGYHFNDILPMGRKILLTQTSDGVLHRDVTDLFSEQLKALVTKSIKALGLEIAGVDVIVNEKNELFFLEANQRAHIGLHSFPSFGSRNRNHVAEAIIDYYFPESVRQLREPHLTYDFQIILQSLRSGQIDAVSLPKFTKEKIISNKRFEGKAARERALALHARACAGALNSMALEFSDGSCEVQLLGAAALINRVLEN